MKGVSLPINVIIILVLGVIVLLAIVGFFTLEFRNASGSMSSAALFQQMCSRWQMLSCDLDYCNGTKGDSIKVGGENISTICEKFIPGATDIHTLCGTCADACCG